MIIEFLKKIKSKLPFIWRFIEGVNGFLVNLLYNKQINKALEETLKAENDNELVFRTLMKDDLPLLSKMLEEQPIGYNQYFNPHEKDLITLTRLFQNKAFLMLGVFDKNEMVGYFFIRFFFNKKAFRGKMVTYNYQGRGIAKKMGKIMSEIAFNSGFSLYATISKDNVRSLNSSKAVNRVLILKEIDDNYVYIKYLPK